MCLDELPLTIEGDVSAVPVVVQLSHLGHELGVVKAHRGEFLKALKC